MNASDTINMVVDTGIRDLLLSAGFEKSGWHFHRRRGKVVQVIEIQLSQYNVQDEGRFFVNVGLAFDQLRQFEGIPLIENPSPPQCAIYRRMESFVSDAPRHWDVSIQTDVDQLANQLARRVTTLVSCFDQFDSLSDYVSLALKKKWFAVPGEYALLERLYRAMGDSKAAAEYKRLAQEFVRNRASMSPEELLEFYGFPNVLRSE